MVRSRNGKMKGEYGHKKLFRKIVELTEYDLALRLEYENRRAKDSDL
jgi:hypothetical protein